MQCFVYLRRTFVELSEATDYGDDLQQHVAEKPQMALMNVVRRLIAEEGNNFFFDRDDDGVNQQVCINGVIYYLKAEDLTESWENHYWTKTKKPLVGFKTIRKDGQPVVTSYKSDIPHYEVGRTYLTDEKNMLSMTGGYYFSQQLQKALCYSNKGTITCMVVASGLILIKNQWDDMCAQNMTIVRKLTKHEINLLSPTINKPLAFWNGDSWDSHDEQFYYDYIMH